MEGTMTKSKKKFHTPEEKVAILKKHLVEGVPLSDICDQHGIHPSVFYRWQKAFFEKAPCFSTFQRFRDYQTGEKGVQAGAEAHSEE